MKIRTNTRDAVAKWVADCVCGKKNLNDYIANSAHSCGGVFYSYSTPIAKYMGKKRGFIFNARKYSVTTSKLQGYIRAAIHPLADCVEMDEREFMKKV